MRLAGQIKGGYYPAPSPSVAAALERIKVVDPAEVNILDPCAGEGAALAQIATTLGVPDDRVYGIELSDVRAELLHQRMPESHIVGPADFFGCKVSNRSFSLVWCNPPFDDEIGGGQRVERKFVMQCTSKLPTGGIMLLVCPEKIANDYRTVRLMNQWYDDLTIMEFPPDTRPFNEVVVFGRKRSRARDSELDKDYSTDRLEYVLPAVARPGVFAKAEHLPDELFAALRSSPLNKHFYELPPAHLPRPPLPINKGQMGLLLASGQLDGPVRPPGQPPHLVKGVAVKKRYLARTEQNEDAKGNKTEVKIYSERIIPVIRALDHQGNLYNFSANEVETPTNETEDS